MSPRLLLLVLVLCVWLPHAQAAEQDGAVILLYHRFGEDALPSTNIRLEQFEAQVAELTSGPYHVLPLTEIVAALSEDRPLPARTIGISVDDAFLSVYAEAWPRLEAAGLPFTLFAATEPLDQRRPNYMSWDQLREMLESELVTLGAHSVTHGHMVEQSTIENLQEIEVANQRFQAELGLVPTLFAYPYGEYDLALRDMVAASGFAAAFGQQSGAAGPSSDLYALPRFALNEAYGTPERFRLVINALPLPVSDIAPADPVLGPGDNPPDYRFTVAPEAGSLANLSCYHQADRLALEVSEERRVAVAVTRAFPPGRSRINCTLPAGDGRWRWFGRQFYVPEG